MQRINRRKRPKHRANALKQTVALRTLGCKQNQFDTEALRQRLHEQGIAEPLRVEEADWLILNTCAVTHKAIARARREINRLRRINPHARIVALGCGVQYSSDDFNAADFQASLPFDPFPRAACEPEKELAPPHGVIPKGRSRGFLRVQTGCDESCAFCIVPHLRGPSRSVPVVDCLRALRELLERDAPEIVLTGTNIALWGRDLPGKPALLDLLRELVSQIGSARLRLSSLEPPLISPDFLEWCLNEPRICRHFHFAFQSGSPEVLNRMGRSELSRDFIAYLKSLARYHPDVCLGADFIVGFPGENEQDFADTQQFSRCVPLSYLHVFPYSERSGTTAPSLAGRVGIRQRLERARMLQQLNAELKRAFVARNLGTVQEVVSLSSGAKKQNEGLTSNYLRLYLKRNPAGFEKRFFAPLANESLNEIHLQRYRVVLDNHH